MNTAERNPWRRDFARRIREFDVGPTELAVHTRATAGALPPMWSETLAQTVRISDLASGDRVTQIGAL